MYIVLGNYFLTLPLFNVFCRDLANCDAGTTGIKSHFMHGNVFSPSPNKKKSQFPLRVFFLMNVLISSFWDINRTEGLQIICHII